MIRSFAAISGLSSAHFFMPGFASKYASKLQPYFISLKLHFGPSFSALAAAALGLNQPFALHAYGSLRPSMDSRGVAYVTRLVDDLYEYS